jgi:hypothetical protein
MLPYCFPHEPAESRAARLPKEEEDMDQSPKTDVEPIGDHVPDHNTLVVDLTKQPVDIGGGWVVHAKDGSELRNGFVSKREASAWASLEVENKRLKAGQYKIDKIS